MYRFDVLTHVTTACTERHQLYDPPESSSVADMLEWGMDDLVDAFGEVLLREQPIVAAAPSEGKTATDDREDAVSAIARVFVTETGTGVARTPPIPPPDARPDGRAQARPSVSHWDAEPIQHAAFVWGTPSASVLQLCDWMSAWANMHDLQPAHFLQAVAGGVRHFQVLMAAAQADGVTDSAGIVRDCTPMLSGRHVRDILRVGLRADGATAHASLTHEELNGLSLAPVNPSAEAAIDAAVMEATNAALTMRAHVEQHIKVLLLLCGAPAAVRDKLAAWLCETHLPRVEALLRASQHADVDTLAEVHTLCCVPIAVTSRVTATAPLEAGDVRVVGHVHIPLGCEANALRSLRPRVHAQISPSIEGSNGAGDEAWNFVDLLQGGSLVLADAEREFCAWDCGPLLVVRLHDSLAT
ncbi:hypothetical protein EON66_03485 [archaeon]|nr:MAG: hypothetical protein EON66_03485 [archaeon]